jgi:CHRD domain
MSRVKLAVAVGLLGAVISASAVAIAGGGGHASTRLSGFEEVPVVLTDGDGKFKARVDKSAREIDFVLRYEDLEGGATTQAHIHIGQELANGGIAAWLCDSTTNPAPAPVDVEPCTPNEGEFEGTITAADVRPVEAQGLRAAETPEDRFDDLVRAIRFGLTYANVHTTGSPGGEIRGQIDSNGKGRHGDDDDRGKGRHGDDSDSD